MGRQQNIEKKLFLQ